ncbi:hypothetical protein GCM10022222_66030 [Amycolatopsis ultiminotia]|uniref:Transposase n=1 Tax=Amycolatopsis ultiminotia TaxID=543629 RepID=A0ABP6XU11_9PSEU
MALLCECVNVSILVWKRLHSPGGPVKSCAGHSGRDGKHADSRSGDRPVPDPAGYRGRLVRGYLVVLPAEVGFATECSVAEMVLAGGQPRRVDMRGFPAPLEQESPAGQPETVIHGIVQTAVARSWARRPPPWSVHLRRVWQRFLLAVEMLPGVSRFQLLSDDRWTLIEDLPPVRTGKQGRPFSDARSMVEGTIYRYRCGIA